MYLRLKRLADCVSAAVLLAGLSPLLVLISLLVWLQMGPGSPFFTQIRPGYREQPFRMVKFRTMLETFDDDGVIRPEGERLTEFGWILRKFSLDELPQLWNVLLGEMSFVGPRPLLMEYLEAYPEKYRRRHHVKPGITGWAQVNGRHSVTLSQRLEFDKWYVDNWSLHLDLKILLLTVIRVFESKNVKRPDQAASDFDDLGFHLYVKKRIRSDD